MFQGGTQAWTLNGPGRTTARCHEGRTTRRRRRRGGGRQRRPAPRASVGGRRSVAPGGGQARPDRRRSPGDGRAGGGGVRSTYSPSSSGVTPCSVDSTTRCCSLGDRQQVAHGDDDAAGGLGRRHPGRRVLDRHARQRVDTELLGGAAVRLGVRLAVHHHVAGDHGLERARRELLEDLVDERSPRHRHEGARNAAQLEGGEQLAGARSPRDPLAEQRGDGVGELVDDLVRSQRHAATGAQHLGGVHQVEADDRHGVVVGPPPAVPGDELVLAADPVRLGVDQRAVHVPQDGRRYDEVM